MMTDTKPADPSRPSVSVVVPFFGDDGDAREVERWLGGLRLAPGDERIVADNTPDGVFVARDPGIRVVPARGEQSSYHARNAGASVASGEWILFIDADCRPPADLVERYFAREVPAGVALLAGPIEPAVGQRGLMPEWARTRGILSQEHATAHDPPAAATANLMVRREAWARVGGFQEGVRSGGDFEFCWRVANAGGALAFRPEAGLEHVHRTSLRGVVRQMARYAAGNAWHRRRLPGAPPAPRAGRSLARGLAGAVFFTVTLRPRRGAMKLVDALAAAAQSGGRHLQNTVAPRPSRTPERIVVATDRFPVVSETFVTAEIAALRELGREVRVEAIERPARPAVGASWGLDVRYLEDEGTFARVAASLWVWARHPWRAAGDFRFRRRFEPDERLPLTAIAPLARRLGRGGERHAHVHFAMLAATSTMRAARIAGARVSLAAHGHDVFATPKALPVKAELATFVAAPCEYTARHVREAAAGARVEVVVMGVDGDRFKRRRPYPGGRSVLAIGRLVEKKGFADLVAAAASMPRDAFDRIVIAGEGPQRPELERAIAAAGLGDRVELLGAVQPDAVRDLLEEADVLAMPCVVAADGDRDAMPVVVKEALAMEVPVVGTDEVGLPEVLRPEWGRLVQPRDPAALAGALAELLALPAAERSAMGAAGRAFVLANFDTMSQARRLDALIAEGQGPGRSLRSST